METIRCNETEFADALASRDPDFHRDMPCVKYELVEETRETRENVEPVIFKGDEIFTYENRNGDAFRVLIEGGHTVKLRSHSEIMRDHGFAYREAGGYTARER